MLYANSLAMSEHLKEISTQVAPGAPAVLVCDGAGWHLRGQKLKVPDNITLLSLPPYSPELNPMENVWDYLRQNKLCAQVWDTYEDIVDACDTAWRFLTNDPDRIHSIDHVWTALYWQEVLLSFCEVVGCGHVSGLLMRLRRRWP